MTFFATSHGKCCVDGIGGLAKQKVAEKAIQRKAIIRDTQLFFEYFEIYISEVLLGKMP